MSARDNRSDDNRYPGFFTPSCPSPTPMSPKQQIIRCGICRQSHSPTQPCTPAPRHVAPSPPRLIRASGIHVNTSRNQRSGNESAHKSTEELEADAIKSLDLLVMRLFKEEDYCKKHLETVGILPLEKKKLEEKLKILDKKLWHASELLENLRGLD